MDDDLSQENIRLRLILKEIEATAHAWYLTEFHGYAKFLQIRDMARKAENK